MTTGPQLIVPHWPAPANVRAVSTTRAGGHSEGVFASLNMGHGRDQAGAVDANRTAVANAVGLDRPACWLRQVHGVECVDAGASRPGASADASFATDTTSACVVMTADCLPVLLAADDGGTVAAAHAGWRGLAGGVLESTVAAMGVSGEHLVAWLGPAIGPAVYEVGPEVRAAFLDAHPSDHAAFTANRPGHWLADLDALARARLARLGVRRVSGGGECTYSSPDRFYSYRRDGSTGRMATFIWLAS